MGKSRKNRKSIISKIQNTGKKALPIVSSGLKTVGSTAKNVAVNSVPLVQKGISNVYGTMAKGINLGVTGAENVVSKVKSMTKKRHSKKRGGKKVKTQRR
jgi:hypothetical protein